MFSDRSQAGTGPRALGVSFALFFLVVAGCGSDASVDELRKAEGAPPSEESTAQAGAEEPESSAARDSGPEEAAPRALAPATGAETSGAGQKPAAGASRPGASKPAAPRAAKSAGTASPSGPAAPAPGGTAPQPPAVPSPPGGEQPGPPADAGGAEPEKCQGAKSTITLGSFGPESGPLGAVFRAANVAARAWASDLNARGGLNCHPVKLIFGDDQGDPNRALAIVRRMVEENHVLAIYNQHSPTTLDAVAPYLESKGVPFVGSVPGSKPIDASPMSFFPSTGDRGTGWAHILPLLQFPGSHKIATFYCREVNGCKVYNDMVKEFAPKIDSEVVFSAQVSLAQPDYTAEVLAAKNAGADALVTIVENASTVRIARSARQQGWNPIITVQHTGHSQSLLQNPDGEGIATSSTTADWAAAPQMQPYRDAVARYQPGGELGGFGAAAWAAGKLIEAGSVNLPDDPTSADLVEGFYALRGETLGGIVPPLTFPREGTRAHVNECVVIGVVHDGRLVTPGAPDEFTCAPGWKPISEP